MFMAALLYLASAAGYSFRDSGSTCSLPVPSYPADLCVVSAGIPEAANWSSRGCCRCDRLLAVSGALGVRHLDLGSRRSARSAEGTNDLAPRRTPSTLIPPR
jgi:hypothetical protein